MPAPMAANNQPAIQAASRTTHGARHQTIVRSMSCRIFSLIVASFSRTVAEIFSNSVNLQSLSFDYSAGSLQTRTMSEILRWLGILIRAAVRERRDLALENLALRQQLPGWFWVVLSRLWASWRRALQMVKADTVVGWQRKGFRAYWARISLSQSGVRPPASS